MHPLLVLREVRLFIIWSNPSLVLPWPLNVSSSVKLSEKKSEKVGEDFDFFPPSKNLDTSFLEIFLIFINVIFNFSLVIFSL